MRSNRPSFWGSLSGVDRFMVGNLFFLYFVQGVFVIGIGSILSMMKAEYGLSYEAGGMLLSAHNIGSLITGLIMGMLPAVLGYKRTLLYFNVLPFAGFAVTLVTGNPVLLFLAILLTGVGRGAVNYYNNQIINFLSRGSSGPLNMLHSFFCRRSAALAVPGAAVHAQRRQRLAHCRIYYNRYGHHQHGDLPDDENGQRFARRRAGSTAENTIWLPPRAPVLADDRHYAVLPERGGVGHGWLVTYFIDSGTASESSAQMLTALLWIVILLGRSACVIIANKVAPPQFLVVASIGIAAFLIVVLVSPGFAPLLAGTFGLGLCMAGMYGTAVSDATGVFKQYPMAMSVFVTITGMGSVIAPSVIGAVAGQLGMRAGLSVLLLPAALLIAFALYNFKKHG